VETIDLFLLGGSYRAVEGGVVIELFGKTRDGGTVIARYYGFRPYFVLTEPSEATVARLKRDPQLVSLDPVELWVPGGPRSGMRVTIQYPWTVPEYREKYRKSDDRMSVLASDIPFIHRFLYDKGLGLTVQFEAEDEPKEIAQIYRKGRVVKIVVTEGRDIRPAEAFRPPLSVLSFDIENAIKERTIYTICGLIDRPGREPTAFMIGDPDERTILERFQEVVAEEDPDIITGYNIGGYDIPLLVERAKALGMKELALGREGSEPRVMSERIWRITGRVVADAWWSVRRDLRPKQESLQFVARVLLGDKKMDVDRRNITQEWEADHQRVMKYCLKDAELALRVLQRLRTIDRAADLATVAHLPLEEGLNGRTSLYIDSLLIPRADRERIGVPPGQFARRENPIEGGYVHSIRPGIYPWVVVLDFKSMYPNIIISKNICFTTLSPDGTTVSPGGARFVTKDVREGVIPRILAELSTERDRLRRLVQTSESPELKAYYDGLQNAVKILMNSFYGVLASSFYRFTDKEIGAAITAFAREAITSIIRALEVEGNEVIYSDTDSVFVRSPVPSLEGAKEFGEGIARRFTAVGATFEFQAVYESFFSHGAKKRYVARALWPREELVVRGYETRRTDAFDFQSEALTEIFELVLKGDTDGAVARARALVQQVVRGEVPPERLVIARSVRAEEQYNESTRDALPFLRVYRQLKEEGYDVIPGMRVAWIVTDAHKSPQQIEPWIEGRAFQGKPDYAYYAERVAQTLARVTEVFHWDTTALLMGSHQKRLVEEEPRPAAPTEDAVGLDTPVAGLAKGPAKRRATTRALSDFE
jgi:DNA polymerase, archaea type